MSLPSSKKTWKNLTPEEAADSYPRIADRARSLGEGAHEARNELAKYLFTANTGAAAGLFLLLRTWPVGHAYLSAFYLFCLGTFFVGFSHLLCADWGHDIASNWARNSDRLLRNEITFQELDLQYRTHGSSRKFQLVRVFLWLSFFMLIAGGITAAIPFWSSPPKQAISVTHAP